MVHAYCYLIYAKSRGERVQHKYLKEPGDEPQSRFRSQGKHGTLNVHKPVFILTLRMVNLVC